MSSHRRVTSTRVRTELFSPGRSDVRHYERAAVENAPTCLEVLGIIGTELILVSRLSNGTDSGVGVGAVRSEGGGGGGRWR